ncbi:MAG: phosphotransferase family protein [Streptosporangiaceae bacterium]
MTGTLRDLDGADLGGAVPEKVLRATGKSLLALGHRDGRTVVIKALCTGEEFWVQKLAREIRVYRAFAQAPPPVRVPRLVHTDGRAVLVLEHIPGHVADPGRYPARPLHPAALDSVLNAVTALARWTPPPGALAPVLDYPDRITRYHAAGFLDDGDASALRALLAGLPRPGQPNHGDPLPSNLLLTASGGCALLDFEFTGLFLPGFDLAMLHALLAGTPGAQDRIEDLAAGAGIWPAFLVNQAMALTRELRIHAELPDSEGELRASRLAFLRPQWQALRERLHAHARR